MKVIMCRGMQGSGKSTWAKQFVKEHQDYKRVCRDDIRHMVSSYTFNKENEGLVTLIERSIMQDIVMTGFNMIVDKMNLNQKDFEADKVFITKGSELAGFSVPEFEVMNFPVTLEEAIKRDKGREFSLGEKVLRGTYAKYQEELIKMLNIPEVKYNHELPDAVIFDVDGTLCINDGHRNAFDFSKVINDKPNKLIIEQVSFHKNQNRKIIIVSGRDDNCLNETEQWFKNNNVIYDAIFMRKTGDKRKDVIIKKEIFHQNIENKFNIVAVYDDRPQVIKGWRELGFFVFDVGKGVDF